MAMHGLRLGQRVVSRQRWRFRPPHYNVEVNKSASRAYASAASTERPSRLRSVLLSSLIFLGSAFGYFYATDTRSSIHRWLTIPLIRTVWPDAEDAHEAGTSLLKGLFRFGLHPRERGSSDDAGDLEIEVFGHKLVNPLGISAGLDKHAEVPTQLLALGAAVVEVGGVTPFPQNGNPRPRVWRIPSQAGMINRYGLNSDGAEVVASRLRNRLREYAYAHGFGNDEDAERFILDGKAGVPPGSLVQGKLLAVQVAKNEHTPDGDIEAIKRDYVAGTRLLARYADVIVVNVSCPNAPGYLELQQIGTLNRILSGVVEAAAAVDRKSKPPAVMVKVSPDEDTEEQIASICAAVWASDAAGIIVGNTTKSRPSTPSYGFGLSQTEATILREKGGYSGPQLFPKTLELVKTYRRVLDYPLQQKRTVQGSVRPALGGSARNKLKESVERDAQNLKPASHAGPAGPLLQIPEGYSSSETGLSSLRNARALLHAGDQSSSVAALDQQEKFNPKVVFCTGGITNGSQALKVLEAGASVAQIYTALVYGGVGKITSMKQEMRQEIRKSLEADVLGS